MGDISIAPCCVARPEFMRLIAQVSWASISRGYIRSLAAQNLRGLNIPQQGVDADFAQGFCIDFFDDDGAVQAVFAAF